MKRLTTDNPTGCSDTMLNLAYAQDRLVHIRNMETPFLQYIRQQCQAHGCDMSEISDDELCEHVVDCGFDTPECPVFLLCTIATQAAELRARLKQHEDAEKQSPTTDAVQVLHGGWEIIEEKNYVDTYGNKKKYAKCTNCEFMWNDLYSVKKYFVNCPNCGAKMDGGTP